MPYITTSFSGKPVQYNKSLPQQANPTLPELNTPIVYANTNDTSLQKAKIYGDIIYADTTKGLTPRTIFDQIKRRIPEVVGNCGVDEEVFLELLAKEVTLFTAVGGHKWNFLTVEQTLNLQNGQLEYKLPNNYDQMIAVWLERDCSLNESGRRVEIIQLDTEKRNFVSGVNFFDVTGGRLRFINLVINDKLESCGNCHQCNACNSIKGTVKLHYHITAPVSQNIDEEMLWFPAHPSALEYFKEKLIAAIYLRAGQSPYISPDAETFFNDLMKYDSNYWPVINKRTNDIQFINFRNIHSRRI